MPYSSQAQQRFFHSPGAAKVGITQGTVNEFDKVSKGMSLPAKAPKKERFSGIKKKLKGN